MTELVEIRMHPLFNATAWRRTVSLIDPAVGISLFAAAILISVGGWEIVHARDQALAEAETGIATLSRALAQHAGRTIEAVDLTLVDAVERVEGGMDAGALRSSLLHRKTMLAQVRDIAIVRPDGSRVADAVPPHAPVTSTDRAYFQWHRDHSSRDLHIDQLLIARTTGRIALPLSRRIDRADGSFGGVVVATLAPEFFEQFYKTVATGAQGTVTLWTSDGHPLFRYPAVPEGSADVVSPNAINAFVQGSDSVQSHSPFDGIERRVAFERVEGLPLVVSASISTSDALASWSRSATLQGFVLAGAVVALTVSGIGLGFHRRSMRAAERAATAVEARYRLLADNATDMITQMSLDGQRLFVSPGSRDLLGFEPQELVGTSPIAAVHPDDADALRGILAELAAGHRDSAVSVNRLQHKDGRWVWVEACLRPLRDDVGRPTGFVAAVRDVTDRKRALDALQASEGRYRVLAETTTDVITQLDTRMRRQYVSPACRHLLGFEPEEMLGLRPSSSIHPDDVDAVRTLAARVLAGEVEGDRVVTTYRTSHKLGHWVWVEAGINLIRDPSTGAGVSLICSLRDVTVRQEAVQMMEVARAAAENAARIKADFVANMSHELRTPLTGILSVHDLLKRDPALGAAQRRLVHLASDAGSSLLSIVNDVLDFSKAEAGQLRLEAIPFDPAALIASCRDLAAEGVGEKPVEIRAEMPATLPRRVVGDPTRLRQVLLNLLTNAVKFTDRGSVTVSVVYHVDEGLMRVDVVDTGVGIPSERLETLFDRFTQADTSITRRYGGTGLGLAISKRLVHLMHGAIGVESSAGNGARFWIEVPLPIDEERYAPRQPLMDAKTLSRRLLLAEDNAINAEIIRAVLTARGYDVVTVGDGAAAVAACEDPEPFDLCLMDLQMPVMDGLTAAIAIRHREAENHARRLPIIGLTANVLAEDSARCLAAGMDDHAAKPVVWPDLFEMIERLIVNSGTLVSARTG